MSQIWQNEQGQSRNLLGFMKNRKQVEAETVNQANVDFGDRLAQSYIPIQEMIGNNGKVKSGAFAAIGPHPSYAQERAIIRSQVPSDIELNDEAIKARFAASETEYDTNLGRLLAFQKASGMSDKKIRRQLAAENQDLLSYAYGKGMIAPKVDGVMDDFLAFIGTSTAAGAGVMGGRALFNMSKTPKTPKEETLKALRKNGFDFRDGKIVKLSEQDLRGGSAKKVLRKKGQKLGGAPEATRKKVDDMISRQKVSSIGNQAIKQSGSKRIRNIATNMALKNVGKHFGVKAVTGVAARIAGGLLSWPVALGIGAAQLAPFVYNKLTKED
tara:strand:- start:10745 stop:11725 length:981 start_codon:yes stop_codon:yes gene_type:complete